MKKLSIIIPVYNEEQNIPLLHARIKQALDTLNKPHEVIYVDDGSKDGTYNELMKLFGVKIIKFRKNFGQTAALNAGITHSAGDVIVTLDGDLQNDPADIPKLIAKLEEGYDVVSGWRKHRKDPLQKRIFSKFANRIRNLLIKEQVHDSGCSLKAYRKECFDDIDLYGEMHRYIPSLLAWKGFKIGEVEVTHHPRIKGKTKYGLYRLPKGFLDLINIWFWRKYSTRPLHIFGGLGIISILMGTALGMYLLFVKTVFHESLTSKITPLIAVLLVIVGVQFFISGLLADISAKNYYLHEQKNPYSIKEIIEK
ncbi:Glycosyltransferase AglJ [uncultured archaeon]|nr:Glycosyltransferase AglJ [uncultured archaeon]